MKTDTKRKIQLSLLTLSLFGVLIGQFGQAAAQSVGHMFSGAVFFKNAKVTLDSGSSLALSSSTVTGFGATQITNRSRVIQLPVDRFVLAADGVTPTTGDPARVIVSSVAVLEWAQGESGKAQTSFVVPSDYVSGGTFTCLIKLDAASADSTFDWEIFVEASGAAPDAATTNQTAVAIANSTTNIQALSLVTVTDTFASGNVVYLNVNRAAGTGAGSDVNLLGCYLTYTADM